MHNVLQYKKGETMYLIVGLGNPDAKYQNTFHNVGFRCVDEFCRLCDAKFDKGECRAITAHTRINGEKVIIAKPITYMNLSGESIWELVLKYKIPVGNLVVCYDDADLPIGNLRIRTKGSGGTHNGMKNVVHCLKTEDVVRMRVGIGHDGDMREYVLAQISQQDNQTLQPTIELCAKALMEFCSGTPIERVMGQFNKR